VARWNTRAPDPRREALEDVARYAAELARLHRSEIFIPELERAEDALDAALAKLTGTCPNQLASEVRDA